MKNQHKSHLIEKFTKYIVGGWLAAALDLACLYVFTDRAWIYYLYSSVFAFCISLIFWFFFQKYITFGDKSMNHMSQWLRFLIYQLVWQWVNMILLRIFVDIYWLNYMLAAVINKGIIFIRNFVMNYFYNFDHSWVKWRNSQL